MCSVPCAVTCHAFSRTKRTCCHFLDRLQACMAMRKLFSLISLESNGFLIPFIPFIPWLSLRPMTFRLFRSFRICKVLSHWKPLAQAYIKALYATRSGWKFWNLLKRWKRWKARCQSPSLQDISTEVKLVASGFRYEKSFTISDFDPEGFPEFCVPIWFRSCNDWGHSAAHATIAAFNVFSVGSKANCNASSSNWTLRCHCSRTAEMHEFCSTICARVFECASVRWDRALVHSHAQITELYVMASHCIPLHCINSIAANHWFPMAQASIAALIDTKVGCIRKDSISWRRNKAPCQSPHFPHALIAAVCVTTWVTLRHCMSCRNSRAWSHLPAASQVFMAAV